MSVRATSRLFRFGLFEADLENAHLTRKGIRIRLQEQPFRILGMLLERPGQIVTREELRNELWPAGTFVDFEGSLNAALKRLRVALDDDADNPRFIETVTKRGYRFIASVKIEDSPPPLEAEVSVPLAVPEPELPSSEHAWPADSSSKFNPRLIFTLLPVVALLAVSAFFIFHRRPAASSKRSAESAIDLGSVRRSIAILGFQNASGRPEDAWLSTALTEMLRTELGTGGKLRVVSGEDIAQFRQGAPWSETDSLSRQTASRIGGALESDLLVLGSYAIVGKAQQGNMRVDFRLQDAESGEILYEGSESGGEGQIFGLAAQVGVSLRQRLGLPMISESEEAGIVSSLPSNPDADRFYSLGLAKLRNADLAAAKDLFLQAEALAPRFPLVHLMLSRAWGGLGYDHKAKDEIKIAYNLSSNLPETDKLQIESAYFGSLRNFDKAIAASRALYELFPDSVDYAEQLVVVLNSAGRHQEALQIIKQLRNLPPPASEDPRIDFWQGTLISYDTPTDSPPYFERAAAAAASHGQKLLYARFRLEQCINLVYGAHPQGASALCQEAYDIFMAAGNRLYAADALRTLADRTGATGDLTGAQQLYQRALAILTPLGEHEKTGIVLNNMAITYENQGQIDQSQKLFRQAAETWRECGDQVNEAVALGNLADIYMARGQLHQAEAHYEDALKRLQDSGNGYSAYELYSIAAVRLYEGDLAGAREYADRALVMAHQRSDAVDLAQTSSVEGDISLAQGDLSAARENYKKSLDYRQQLGNTGIVAENQAALAAVSIEEDKYTDAEPVLRSALAEFQKEKAFTDVIRAEIDLSRVLLREGKLSEARQIISDALSLARKSQDPSLKLPAAIQDARIEAAEISSRIRSKPDLSDPRGKLKAVLLTAQRLDYYGIACDARLALGELEFQDNPSAARAQLSALALDADSHGLGLVVRKAKALQNGPAPTKR